MPFATGVVALVRGRIAMLQLQLARRDQEAGAEAAARRLDADEVGRRADRLKAEHEAGTARSNAEPPREA
jgi:hypothetical protein